MPKKNDTLTFEDALGRLETILESMESGDTPLADLVAKRNVQHIAQRQVDQLLVLDDNMQAGAC